jgi:iron complex transport system ATP-binding protein
VTAIVALHDLNLAAMFCDTVVVLQNGRVITAGPPAEVLTSDLIADVYGVRAHVTRDDYTGRPTVTFQPGPPKSEVLRPLPAPTSVRSA